MEITHIIIKKNIIYLFKKNEEFTLCIFSYDINQNFNLTKKIKITAEYLDYYINAVCLHDDKFYILGGLLNGNMRSLKYITIINSNFESIIITKANNCELPQKRIFIDNNNIVIVNNILYLAGGCSDNDSNDIYSDFWSYNLNTKIWTCISKNIFDLQLEFNSHDYVEIAQNNENLILIGKFLNRYIYIYNIHSCSFTIIDIKNIYLLSLQNNYHIQKILCVENFIYLIMKNTQNITSVKFNINDKSYEIYKICDNIYDDVLMSNIDNANDNNNDNIVLIEKKINADFNIFRFNNKLSDLIINKIRTNKACFIKKDYDTLYNSLKIKIKIE